MDDGTMPQTILAPISTGPGPTTPIKADNDRGNEGNWRPWLMSPAVVGFFAALPLLILGVTEYLYQSAVAHSGLFRDNAGNIRYIFRETVAQFFSLAVVVAVGLYFYDLDLAVKTMEPYYQLSKPGGELGAHSICVNYFGPIYLSPWKAFRHRHWAVVCSSMASIMTTNALPTLSLGIFADDNQTPMNPVYTRGFESCCAVISILAIALAVQIYFRKTGMDDHPSPFTTLMKCTRYRDRPDSVYNFIKQIERQEKERGAPTEGDGEAFSSSAIVDELSLKSLKEYFRPQRFQLIPDMEAGDKTARQLIVLPPSDPVDEIYHWYSLGNKAWYKYLVQQAHKIPASAFWKKCQNGSPAITVKGKHLLPKELWQNNHPMIFQTLPLTIVGLCLVGLSVIAAGQPYWARDTSFFTFIGKKRFARSTVSTIINTLIWNTIEADAKMMQPMYVLLETNGIPTPELDREYLMMAPLQDLWNAFSSRLDGPGTRWRPSERSFVLILLGTYAAWLFVIFWNILALSDPDNISTPIVVCLVACESFMLASLSVIWRQRRRPIVPRIPASLASNLIYVYATDLGPEDVEEPSERIDEKQETIGADAGERTSTASNRGSFESNAPSENSLAEAHELQTPQQTPRTSISASLSTARTSNADTVVVSPDATIDADICPLSAPPGEDQQSTATDEDTQGGDVVIADQTESETDKPPAGMTVSDTSIPLKSQNGDNTNTITRRLRKPFGLDRRKKTPKPQAPRCRLGEFKVGDEWHVGIARLESIRRDYKLPPRNDPED
ncbi:hypothetical protein FN846DRAFT_346450 [Sphaerosporella brunnea]|uniref:Uncharacterized protein n=1 Tax=Sphaerosporella brunnea TaxID=1250544 RepID=A0A5J5EJC7_9PEZI|nr:hypothetical protein FN846DRAFT_346450 [Sphaerosporella brunnea]